MRFVSTITLSAALALAAVTVAGIQPAVAKDKKEEPVKGASFKLSKGVREAIAAAQVAVKANDFTTADAKLAEATAAASTDDDRYVIGSVKYDVGRGQNNLVKQGEAIDAMIASGRVDSATLPNFYFASGQIAYNNKDMAKAEQRLGQAIQAGVTDPNAFALLVEAKSQQGKPAEAITVLEQGIAKQKAAGQVVPNEWYARGISIGYNAKLAPQLEHLTQEWLAAYPSASNWRDSLITFRDLNHVDAEYELDVDRLMRAAGALKGERDYMDYVQATYLKFPAEANAVIDEGVASGNVKLTGNAAEIKGIVKGKLPSDRAATQSAANDVKAGKGTGRLALATADALYGAGQYAEAVEIYKIALTKGGVDANVANSRMGAALARAGQVDAAKQAFAAVTGPRQGLARYWLVWLDQKKA